jgi:hypothetical protein
MSSNDHAECKTALIGLLDALAKIKMFAQSDAKVEERLKAIEEIATTAIERHKPHLAKI